MSHTPVIFDNSLHKNLLDKVSCSNPFTGFHIEQNGNVGNCCYSWMPTFCGNLFEKSLLQIMEDTRLADIRKSVTDGSFKYCNGKVCPNMMDYTHGKVIIDPILKKEDLPELNKKNLTIFLDYDPSCNLYCGSCRTERILFSRENLPDGLKRLHETVMNNLKELLNLGYQLTVQVTGSGDAFGSPLYWEFLKGIQPSDNFIVRLSTNGTLMSTDKFNHPYAAKIDHLSVSIDAFTEETYKKIRRGGNFKALRKNLDDLDMAIINGNFKNLPWWKANFIVQEDNFREMAEFAKWMLKYRSIQFIWFNLIAKWGHLGDDEFAKKAIWLDTHPDHREFLEVLQDPVFDDPRVLLGNMANYRNNSKTTPA